MHDWEFVATSIGCVCGCDHSRLTSGPTVEHHSTSKLSWHTPETQEYPCTHKHTGTRVNSLWHCFTEIFLLLAMDIIAKMQSVVEYHCSPTCMYCTNTTKSPDNY